MFGRLFTRKPINKVKEVDEAPVMVAKPQLPNLATMLILMMTSYMEQNEKTAGQLVPVIKDVRTAYDRLLKLGMGQTQNARALQTQIEANDKMNQDYEKANALIRFVKASQEHFGPRSILVSYEAFDELCKKYNLECGLLSDYCGVIPERNVQDIEKVQQRIPGFIYKESLNRQDWMYFDYCDYWFVSGADVWYKHEDEIRKLLAKQRNIVALRDDKGSYKSHKSVAVEHVRGLYMVDGYMTKFYGGVIDRNTLFIACPKEYLKNPGIKIQPKPVDPAIYQFTPYGILVHTIWGEEAEDEAFKHFMDVNLRITQS